MVHSFVYQGVYFPHTHRVVTVLCAYGYKVWKHVESLYIAELTSLSSVGCKVFKTCWMIRLMG